MILDSPNCFVQVQIVLVGSKLFWSGPNHFGWMQIILVRFKLDFCGLNFVIWTCPKQLALDQNDLNGTKFQNHFELKEGQGISVLIPLDLKSFKNLQYI